MKDNLSQQNDLRSLVRRALERRRQVIVYEIARMCEAKLGQKSLQAVDGGEVVGSDWVRVESLSQLRTLVGGRFQNLKERWVNAGFPLREHRGDRTGQKQIENQGWIELVTWIHKQGFEVRLAEEQDAWLFELRKT